MRGMIRSAWVDNFKPKLQEMPIIQPVVENIFTLDFEKREEMEAIWKERPCPISGTLMQLKRLSGLENAQNISFKMVEFWVQIHNLPEARSECGLRRKNEEEGLPLPSIQRWGPWTRASSPLFSPRTSQQQEGEADLNRAATPTSNSPGGFQIQSPPTTGMGTTRSLNQMAPPSSMITPAANQSPRSSFAQNFSFSPTTDLFPTPNSFSPSPQRYSEFGQNLGVISSPSQGTNMSRNLFGFPSAAPLPNSIPQIPSYQDPLPGFITSNQSPLPYQAHANYIFNQNYFHSSPSGAQPPNRVSARGQSSKNRTSSPSFQKKKRKTNSQHFEGERKQGSELIGAEEDKTGDGQDNRDDEIPPGFEPNLAVVMVADSKPPEAP